MEINGLTLPKSFVRDVQSKKFRRERGCWQLNEDLDAYGNRLETEIGEVCETKETLLAETDVLWRDFVDEGSVTETNEWEDEPGYIPYISDFSKVVWFAAGGDGSPFCFDFRDNENNPSIIWWDDAYWRRIAPDYDSFIQLFDFNELNNQKFP